MAKTSSKISGFLWDRKYENSTAYKLDHSQNVGLTKKNQQEDSHCVANLQHMKCHSLLKNKIKFKA